MKRIAFIIAFFSFLIAACSKENAQVVLQAISIKPDTLTLTTGNSTQLSPTFTPAVFSNIAVEWSTSDNSVVSVSAAGTVLAVKSGTAWVTVKDKNGATSGKVYVVIP